MTVFQVAPGVEVTLVQFEKLVFRNRVKGRARRICLSAIGSSLFLMLYFFEYLSNDVSSRDGGLDWALLQF